MNTKSRASVNARARARTRKLHIEINPVSHEEAIKQKMAERFALGELPDEDRARFEAHFFDCKQCFENTRLSAEINPVSHEEAIKQQMAERFALGELPDEDRAGFEAHFFACKECFEDTRLSAEFLRHSHTVLSPRHENGQLTRFFSDLWRPAPVLMTVLFLCASGGWVYEGQQIADLRRPKQEMRVFLTEQTRSPGNGKLVALYRGMGVSLEAGFVSLPGFRSYRAQIFDVPDKHLKCTVPLRLDEKDVTFTIIIPPGVLRDGTYSMIIQGQRSDDRWETLKEDNKELGGIFHLQSKD